jgi:hypothetical protein
MSKYVSHAKDACSEIKTMYYTSELESRTREHRNFHATESTLPVIRRASSDKRPSLSQDVLSYLGPWNPHPQPISPSDTVWLLDNTAYRNPTSGQWEAEFVVAVFDKNSGVEVSEVVACVAEKVGVAKGDKAEERIKERLMPFLQEILPGKVVNAEFASRDMLKLGPGGRNGISSEVQKLLQFEGGEFVTTIGKVPQGVDGVLRMQTVYAEAEGWGVISG